MSEGEFKNDKYIGRYVLTSILSKNSNSLSVLRINAKLKIIKIT